MSYKHRKGIMASFRYLLMTLLALVFATPIIFMLVSSLKPSLQILRDSSSLLAFLPVGEISVDNYFRAADRAPIGRFLFNSFLVTSVTVSLGLFVNSLLGFSLANMRWKGKGILLSIVIATLILPFETIAVPLLLVVSRLPWIGSEGLTFGWFNSYQVQILPFIVDAFSIYLFVQFFKSIPKELFEAARMDGATWFQIFARIVVPISGPVFATAAILRGLYMWNQYLWPSMVVQTNEFRPVMIGLGFFWQTFGSNTPGEGVLPWGEMMAYLSIITIPLIVFFLSLQKAFVESIASTGIKG